MRLALSIVFALHGLLHLLGVAKAFHLAELDTLRTPISPAGGIAWGVASALVLAAALANLTAPTRWWALGLAAAVLSQVLITRAWADAAWGSLPNLLLFVAALAGALRWGPGSLWAAYDADRSTIPAPGAAAPITEADLAPLPAPVQRYLRRAGVIGPPRVRDVYVELVGRIRGGADQPWMPFVAEQHNTLTPPRRYFWMSASRGGVPFSVYHRLAEGQATMRVRLLGFVPLVDAAGPEMSRAEAVTFFNDMCLMAPGSLTDPAIRWAPVDDLHVDAAFSMGANTIRARLTFDPAGDLVDFRSEDRLQASPDGKRFTPAPWRTPIDRHGALGPFRLATHGDARWITPDGELVYIEMDITRVEVNTGPEKTSRATTMQPAPSSTGAPPAVAQPARG